MRILLAGATGVIGRPLLTLLARAGHTVTGTTRSAARAPIISDAGATPAVVDVFDAAALREVARAARAPAHTRRRCSGRSCGGLRQPWRQR